VRGTSLANVTGGRCRCGRCGRLHLHRELPFQCLLQVLELVRVELVVRLQLGRRLEVGLGLFVLAASELRHPQQVPDASKRWVVHRDNFEKAGGHCVLAVLKQLLRVEELGVCVVDHRVDDPRDPRRTRVLVCEGTRTRSTHVSPAVWPPC